MINPIRLAALGLFAGATATVTFGQSVPASRPASAPTTAAAAGVQTMVVKDLSPSSVTMSMRDVSLEEIVAELSKQAQTSIDLPQNEGMPYSMGGNRWPKVVYSIELKDQPFWIALEQICAATGTSYNLHNPHTNQQGILIQPNRSGRGWAGYAAVGKGPMMVMLQGVHRGGVVNVGNYKEVERSITLNLIGQVEPKFAPIRGPLNIKVTKAIDDNGAELVPVTDIQANPELASSFEARSGSGGISQSAVIRLTDASGTARKIASLTGTATFRVNSKMASLKVDNLSEMSATPLQFRDLLLVISRPRMTDSQWTIPLTIFRNGGTDVEWQATQRAMQTGGVGAMKLLDAKGRAWPSAGVNNMSGGYYDAANSKIDLQVTFRRDQYGSSYNRQNDAQPGTPARLEWDVPAESTDLQVDFEFRDIALP